jgi:hypothetical protein
VESVIRKKGSDGFQEKPKPSEPVFSGPRQPHVRAGRLLEFGQNLLLVSNDGVECALILENRSLVFLDCRLICLNRGLIGNDGLLIR